VRISATVDLPSGPKRLSSLSPITRNALARWKGHVAPAQLRAVVFDIGNVAANWYPGAASLAVCTREGWEDRNEPNRVQSVLLDPELKGPFEKGEMDFGSFYENVRERLGLRNTSQRQLARIWNDVFEIRQDTVDLALGLQDLGLSTYILSDTNSQHFRYLSGVLPFIKRTNGQTLSHRTGFYKCDGPRAFQIAMSLLERDGIRPDQAIYFDDRDDYTARAISLGLPALTFLAAADARTVIREVWGLGI